MPKEYSVNDKTISRPKNKKKNAEDMHMECSIYKNTNRIYRKQRKKRRKSFMKG